MRNRFSSFEIQSDSVTRSGIDGELFYFILRSEQLDLRPFLATFSMEPLEARKVEGVSC